MRRYIPMTVILAAVALGAPALANPPVSFPPGTDLDANGSLEREYSRISQQFTAPAIGGRVGFDWQVFSSEFFGGAAEDVFIAELLDVASGVVVDQEAWALDPTPTGYMGPFTPVGAPPMGTTGPSEATAGSLGLMLDAFHLDGGSGWATSFLSFPPAAAARELVLQFLVADAVDRNADTSLAIDRIEARDVTGAPIATLTNPGFEAQLTDWTVAGNAGSYTELVGLFNGLPVVGTEATDGKWYAVVSTAGVAVPEPASLALLIGALCSVTARHLGRRSQ